MTRRQGTGTPSNHKKNAASFDCRILLKPEIRGENGKPNSEGQARAFWWVQSLRYKVREKKAQAEATMPLPNLSYLLSS